jgi:putative ribosome biogenesis GTPase RsgA
MSNLVTRAVELIYQMDNAQLNEVVDAIKLKRTYLAKQATRSVIVGDTVEFDGRGRTIRGVVKKVNQKTLQVYEAPRGSGFGGTNWKVTASLVRKAQVA